MEEAATPSDAPLYAGFWRRLAAALLDGAIILALFWLAIDHLEAVTSGTSVKVGIGVLLILVYFTGFHLLKQQATPGKLALKIKLAAPDGARVGLERVVLRALAACVSAASLMLGFALIALNGKRRALHDFIAHTVVVRSNATGEDLAGGGDVMVVDRMSTILQVAAGLGLGALLIYFVPSFFDREKRTELAVVMQSVEPVQADVVNALREGRALPVGAVKPTSKYVARIYVTRDGEILIRLDDERYDGAVIRLTPEQQTGKPVRWSCYSDEIRKAYLPASCRD
ncbi:MAG: RDD family protein [Usitatibacter sp.]